MDHGTALGETSSDAPRRLYRCRVDFDRLTAALLVLRDNAPELDAAEAAALQDAHMAHLADLHEAGYLLAAGPLLDDRFRGLSILKVDAEEARRLKEADPAVQAGRFDVIVMPWMVPAGAMHFAPARFPRSMAEIE
jgi:uncharacterized protein YciI